MRYFNREHSGPAPILAFRQNKDKVFVGSYFFPQHDHSILHKMYLCKTTVLRSTHTEQAQKTSSTNNLSGPTSCCGNSAQPRSTTVILSNVCCSHYSIICFKALLVWSSFIHTHVPLRSRRRHKIPHPLKGKRNNSAVVLHPLLPPEMLGSGLCVHPKRKRRRRLENEQDVSTLTGRNPSQSNSSRNNVWRFSV